MNRLLSLATVAALAIVMIGCSDSGTTTTPSTPYVPTKVGSYFVSDISLIDTTGAIVPFATDSSVYVGMKTVDGVNASILQSNTTSVFGPSIDSMYFNEASGAINALDYRRLRGGRIHEIAMAVGWQVMVDTKGSGVLYTIDPAAPGKDTMLVSAVWGLGAPMVEGAVQADQFTLERTSPHAINSLKMVPKTRMLVPNPQGGTQWREVEEDRQYRPCLNPEQLRELAEMALLIERYFKRPQDIEWALEASDGLVILQARPLNIKPQSRDMVRDIAEATQHYPVLLQGRGAVVQRGIATGKVFMVHSDDDLTEFPQGAILVPKHRVPPWLRARLPVLCVGEGLVAPPGAEIPADLPSAAAGARLSWIRTERLG